MKSIFILVVTLFFYSNSYGTYVKIEDQNLQWVIFCDSEEMQYTYEDSPEGPSFVFKASPNLSEKQQEDAKFFGLRNDQDYYLRFSAPRSTSHSSMDNFSINIHLSKKEQIISDFPWNKNAVKIEFYQVERGTEVDFKQVFSMKCL